MDSSGLKLHSRFNRIMAVVVWTVAALVAVMTLWSGDPTMTWLYPAAALAALLGWAGLWRPYVGVTDAGVTLQNVTHRVDVPWEALIHIDTKHALTLFTPGRRFAAWSAPAPGFVTAIIAGRSTANREARAAGGAPRVGDLLGTESGDAATFLREEWQRRRDAGLIGLGSADDAVVPRHWDMGVITATVVLFAVTVVVLGVTG